ncbi:hypothetical protein MNBD_GAMMA07-470 [hydrothermal vent metagenome]|uniref:Uncharacterized protein n=1 Tax=hydrothermal vent metagenome TaxID=652676 RepID=A0A3B0WLH2_9ZZZZ
MGIDNVVGSQLACINLSDNVQAWNDIPVIEPERIILDIPHIEINETSINAIKALKESDYTLALDDIAGNKKIAKIREYYSYRCTQIIIIRRR